MGPAQLQTKNDCAGEGQKQFTRPADRSGNIIKEFTALELSYSVIFVLLQSKVYVGI
jgi:hypothetical protein